MDFITVLCPPVPAKTHQPFLPALNDLDHAGCFVFSSFIKPPSIVYWALGMLSAPADSFPHELHLSDVRLSHMKTEAKIRWAISLVNIL
jgi:hypothetical protein